MKKVIIILCSILVSIIVLVFVGYYHFFCDINAIKPGEKMMESVSPNGEYTITAYLNDGGATTSYAVLCVLSYGNRERNIYWNYRCESAEIEWIDDDTVTINGIRIENIFKDEYDYRQE